MRKNNIRLKSPDDIKRIADAGKIISDLFNTISKPGLENISTWEVDTFIDSFILKRGGRAAFKTVWDYNYASCISINNEVAHGIPSRKRKINNGDIVKIDVGVALNGYFSDACTTFTIGSITDTAGKIVTACKDALSEAIKILAPGKRIGDIGAAIEDYSLKCGFSVVKNFTGHGIGYSLHEPPLVPHCGEWGSGEILKEGLVLAIEPILNEGSGEVAKSDDGWTVFTKDGLLSAQFEHSVAITENGPIILTG